ncbi:hypothetical protein [Kordia sp.]|uniref:hypothetical protein n=1 Tax=Kordia sp. TaxID=1965332 RepID=UPI003B5A5F89
MKKQNLTSLKISKVSISNFIPSDIKGGASGVKYTCGGGHTCVRGGCTPISYAPDDCDYM